MSIFPVPNIFTYISRFSVLGTRLDTNMGNGVAKISSDGGERDYTTI